MKLFAIEELDQDGNWNFVRYQFAIHLHRLLAAFRSISTDPTMRVKCVQNPSEELWETEWRKWGQPCGLLRQPGG